MSESYLTVLDRITEGMAVIENADAPVDQLDLHLERVPSEDRHEGAVFEAQFIEGELEELTYRPEEETSRRNSSQERFDRLSKRLSDEEWIPSKEKCSKWFPTNSFTCGQKVAAEY